MGDFNVAYIQVPKENPGKTQAQKALIYYESKVDDLPKSQQRNFWYKVAADYETTPEEMKNARWELDL